MFDWILERLGIVPRSFRALFAAQLAMVYRSPIYARVTASPAESFISPWFWVLGQNLIIGAIASLVLFARVDAFFFTLGCLTVSMVVTLAAMIVELNDTVFDPDDQEVLGHLPIPSRTYAAVRLAGLATYVFATIGSVNLFPALVGASLRDAPDGFVVTYLLAATALSSLVVAIVIGTMTWSSKYFAWSQVQEVAGWVPTALILVLFYGGQFALRDKSQQLAWLAYDLPSWITWLPVAWLAASIAPPPETLEWIKPWSLAVWCAAAVIVWVAVLQGLDRFYGQWQLRATSSRVDRYPPLRYPGRLVSPWSALILRDSMAQVGFWLTGSMLKRDAEVRLKCWTSFTFAAAPLVLGWMLGELRDPWKVDLSQAATALASTHLLALSIPGILSAVRFSRDHEAAWIFQVAPITRVASVFDGVAWMLLLRFLIPILLVMVIIWSFVWQSPSHALIHGAVGLLSTLSVFYLALTIDEAPFPFSDPSAANQWTSSVAKLTLIVAGWASLITGIHLAFLVRGWPVEILVAGLAVSLLVNRWLYRWVDQNRKERNRLGLGRDKAQLSGDEQ